VQDSDAEAKREAIRAYFNRLQQKAEFTLELHRSGHRHEALLLCCVYIEALGNRLYWPEKGARRNFARVLLEHGGDSRLCLVHPKALLDALGSSKDMQAVAEKLEPLLTREPVRLLTFAELEALTSPHLTERERILLHGQRLLGTLGSIAYDRLRNPLAHLGGGPEVVLFSEATHEGETAPEIGFDPLNEALGKIISVARRSSLDANAWFGHDFKKPGQQRATAG
jgi:hypothetical protein